MLRRISMTESGIRCLWCHGSPRPVTTPGDPDFTVNGMVAVAAEMGDSVVPQGDTGGPEYLGTDLSVYEIHTYLPADTNTIGSRT